MAERLIVALSKSVEGNTSGGSNPPLSARLVTGPAAEGCGFFVRRRGELVRPTWGGQKTQASEASLWSWGEAEAPILGVNEANPSISSSHQHQPCRYKR